ncbi:hypothetical protein Tco_1525823 [Tanacetum coccineum]
MVVAIIGVVVVVGGVPSIIDLSFVIIGLACAIPPGQGGFLGPVFLLGLSAFAMAAACASRAAVKSAISCRRASKVMAGVLDVDVLLGGILST